MYLLSTGVGLCRYVSGQAPDSPPPPPSFLLPTTTQDIFLLVLLRSGLVLPVCSAPFSNLFTTLSRGGALVHSHLLRGRSGRSGPPQPPPAAEAAASSIPSHRNSGAMVGQQRHVVCARILGALHRDSPKLKVSERTTLTKC